MDDIETSTGLIDRLQKHITENFVSYCPTATFAKGNDERIFLNAHGEDCLIGWRIEQGKESSLRRLFDVGNEAYALLNKDVDPSIIDRTFFDELFAGYRTAIAELKELIIEKIRTKSIIAVDQDGERIDVSAITDIEDVEAIKIGRSILKRIDSEGEEWKRFYVEMLCVGCLREIDHTIVALVHNPIDAIESTLIAKEMLDLAKEGEREDEIKKEFVIRRARKAAAAKLANDPRQDEKQFIRECWQDWQRGKSQYPSKAAFSRDMLTKVEHLTSAKKVEDWCREWEKEHSPS